MLRVVQPPAIFVLAGLCGPDTLWLVEKALYGLTTSPKEWTQFRNQSLGDFRWHQNGCIYEAQKTNDQDIWKIVAVSQSPAEPCGITEGAPVQRCRSPKEWEVGSARSPSLVLRPPTPLSFWCKILEAPPSHQRPGCRPHM